MVKNIIIFILASLLLVIVASSIASRRNLNIIDRDFQWERAIDRANAVEKAKTYKVVMVISDDNYTAKESFGGILEAIKIINDEGGINGKPIEMKMVGAKGTKQSYLETIQEYCTPLDVALCIGPFISGFVPSSRSLMQFEAMPLVSPMTVFAQTLPKLEPESYASYFPPIEILVSSIAKRMSDFNHKNILLISPKDNSYGAIVATAFQGYRNTHSLFRNTYRINYNSPLNAFSLQSFFVGFESISKIDAIFFTGDYNDYVKLKAFLKRIEFMPPIFATEDLNVDNIEKDNYQGGLYVPTMYLHNDINDFKARFLKDTRKECNYSIELSSRIIFDFRNYLNKHTYEPFDLVRFFTLKSKELYSDQNNYEIDFKVIKNYKSTNEVDIENNKSFIENY